MGAVEVSVSAWVGFILAIIIMLVVDLIFFQKKPHEVGMKEAITWIIVWITAALTLNTIIWIYMGPAPAIEYFTGYLMEESLSLDNLFVFVVIFSYFRVDPIYQHRVLFWGILGAIISRAAFIVVGIELISAIHWILYLFGAILIFTGIKLLFKQEESVKIERNPIFRAAKRLLPITNEYHGEKFTVFENKKFYFTPLFLVLLIIETTDILFAVDSVPAVLGITREPFIAFSSNIMAVLGLRALYFVVAKIIVRLEYLHIGLSAILIFIGIKMLLEGVYKVPTLYSLGFIVLALTISVIASIRKTSV